MIASIHPSASDGDQPVAAHGATGARRAPSAAREVDR
jgi:hypothetical protein